MNAALRIGVALALASCSGAASNSSGPQAPEPIEASADPNLAPTDRLGKASSPTAYQLRLALDSRTGNFLGEASIDIEIHQPLHTLWLHSKDLQISSAQLEQGGQFFDLATATSGGDSELLGLTSNRVLAPGHAQLHLRWRGNFGTIQGLFRQSENGVDYIYSDFEATDARAAFPGYDDPRFKIPWTVALEVPSEHRAFSNAPEARRTRLANGNDLVQFEPTRPLPSYLVAVAAGPFETIAGTAAKTPLRIIAPEGQAEAGRYVLEQTGTMLSYLETYLGMPTPFPKLDFIAVPRFGGAMENPGLITFSSSILLVGQRPTEEAKRRALGVTAHELAHLWFGDFITPDYWNDLWLNEAFATWLSDKAVAHAQPKRAAEVLDIADKTAAYSIDHGLGGRRVREPITNREDIRAAFDRITYRKGGALLTMLERWLGAKRMQTAVQRYLRTGAGGTVVAETLIASMSETSGEPKLAAFFTSYLNQTGIPQIHASVSCAGTPSVTLRQQRYLPLEVRPHQRAEDRQRQWHIPVCFRYADATAKAGAVRHCVVLDKPEIVVPLASCPAWFLPNDGDAGYFHYLLSAKAFKNISQTKLSPRETLGFAHSIIAGLHGGQLDVAETLALLEPLRNTTSEKVHEVVMDTFYALSRSVISDGQRPAFSAMIRRWYEPLMERIGTKLQGPEAPWISATRPTLLLLLADLGDSEFVRATVTEQVNTWLMAPRDMDFALLSSWLQVAALRGNRELMERYRSATRKTDNGIHRALLFSAMHGFRDPQLLADVLHRGSRRPEIWAQLADAIQSPAVRARVLAELDAAEVRDEDLSELFSSLCTARAIADVQEFINDASRAPELLAPIHGCIAFAKRQHGSAAALFSSP